MKIKHKESGKVIEVAEGTKYPKEAYELVDDSKKKAKADKAPEDTKESAGKKEAKADK